jgi:hypothetical protein
LLVLARTKASRFGAIHRGWGGVQGRAAGSALARDGLARTDGNVEAGEHLFGHEQRVEDDGVFVFGISSGEAFGSVGLLHEATELDEVADVGAATLHPSSCVGVGVSAFSPNERCCWSRYRVMRLSLSERCLS